LAGELAAIVTKQHLWHSTLLLQPVQRTHYIFSLQALAGFNGHTRSGVDIDDRQTPKPPAILQLIRYKVQTPCLVRSRGYESFLALLHRLPFALRSLLQRQSLFPVQPVHQMLAYLPALPVQQDSDLAVSVSHPALCDLPNP